MRVIKRLFAMGAAVAVIGVFAAPAQAGAPQPVPQRASDWVVVQCTEGGVLNYPAAPAFEGQTKAQNAFNTGGGSVALGETCEVVEPQRGICRELEVTASGPPITRPRSQRGLRIALEAAGLSEQAKRRFSERAVLRWHPPPGQVGHIGSWGQEKETA